MEVEIEIDSQTTISYSSSKISPKIDTNLQNSFSTTSLCPFDLDIVLKNLPSEGNNPSKLLDPSLLDFLK